MIDGYLVVDAAVHGFNFKATNARVPFVAAITQMLHGLTNDVLNPPGDGRYRLTLEEFSNSFDHQPALLEHVLFAESPVDVAVYHGVPMYGFYGDGSSPLWVAEEIARRLPHRIFLYADLSPHHPDPFGWIDEVAAKPNVLGIKFYPVDMVDGEIAAIDHSSDDVMALVEHCRAKGIRTVALHKAVPLGPISRELYRVDDVQPLVAAFPDLRFEIVHGGFAFAEQTARILAAHDNVWINLETNPCFALNHADKFADMMEPLLRTGRHDRIVFATGASGVHPRPFAEAFWRYRAPRGYCEMTDAIKAGILGRNYADLQGWSVADIQQQCAEDRYGWAKAFHPPWSVLRPAMAAA